MSSSVSFTNPFDLVEKPENLVWRYDFFLGLKVQTFYSFLRHYKPLSHTEDIEFYFKTISFFESKEFMVLN